MLQYNDVLFKDQIEIFSKDKIKMKPQINNQDPPYDGKNEAMGLE